MYYKFLGYSLVIIPCMQKDFFPRELHCYFFLFSECDEANSHVVSLDPKKNCAKK